MKKLSKNSRTVIIAIAVPLVLAAAVVILLVVLPKASPDVITKSSSGISLVEEQAVSINNKNADDVNYLTVSNESGFYEFTRVKRTIKGGTESGETVNKEEYYWTSEQMLDIPQDDSAVRSFITGLAQLSGVSVVEENADDLAKYGLESPVSTVEAYFDDQTRLTMLFGIRNPANEQTVYFRLADTNKVYLVNYYAAANVYSDVRKFAQLTLTEPYSSDKGNELDYLRITRSDMKEPVEIEYISTESAKKFDENFELTTLSTHRFISPITAEIDSAGRGAAVNGKTLCYGVYDLTMESCEELQKTNETLRTHGLDKPFARVEFKYGGKEYVMTLSAEDTERKLYYVALEGVPGIYSLTREGAPWCTFAVENLVSAKPISPYIWSVESVEITTADAVYKYNIDDKNKTVTCGEVPIDAEKFRGLFSQLTGEFGEKVYMTQVSDNQIPEVTVKFTYWDEYTEVYNGISDTLEFFASDSRKHTVNLNGKTLYKVRDVYVKRLLDNITALNSGGEISIEW